MIIDAFPFADEILMLEMRLGQMDEIVDKFVIIEVSRTYRGDPKPLYYQQNKHLFERWNHKILCISPELPNVGSWEFEILQRNALLDAIKSLNPGLDDVVTFSDADEVPNPVTVRNYTPNMGLRNLKQYTSWYNYNSLMDYGNRSWSRARIGRIRDVYERGLYHFRGGPQDDLDPNFPSLDEGGWHGTYFASIERIRRKVNSFSHDDLAPFINGRTDKQLAEDILNGINLYHLAGTPVASYVDSDDPVKVPPYFRANKERFKEFTKEHFAETYKHLF